VVANPPRLLIRLAKEFGIALGQHIAFYDALM